MTFHLSYLGIGTLKKEHIQQIKGLNFPNCQAKKIMNDISTDPCNCWDVNTFEDKLTELKERWLEIETGFKKNEHTDQFVKYFQNHKKRGN